MSKSTELTQKLVRGYINSHDKFSMQDLENDVFKEGGIARMGPAYTIKDYLQNLVFRDILDYNPLTGQYSHPKHA